MKKNSKAVERHPAETIGVDLGDKMSKYAILNQKGVVVEEGSFRNNVESIAKHFGERGKARVALEVGTQSAWISREFAKRGHEVIVANARELKWITSSDTKNDRNDAVKLARLARADRNLLAPVEHRTAEQQAELAVIRARDALVKSRSLLVNTARSLAKGFGLRLPASITHTFGARALARLAEDLRTAMSGLLEQVDALSLKIRDYNQRIEELAVRHPEVERLASVPGVGTLTAATFRVNAGPRERFAHSRDVGSFPGPASAAKTIRRARPQAWHFQEWRQVFAQAAGAVRTPHSRALGQRVLAAPVGIIQERWHFRQKTCGSRGGSKAGCAAAPAMDDRGNIQTLS